MKAIWRVVLPLFFLLTTPSWAAQELKPFAQGSLKEIVAARQGKPFILGLWSLTCTHCRVELSMLSGLLKKYPDLNVVLISTDTPEESEVITATLQQFALGRAQAWVFVDPFAERLRFEIDRKWHGELPRTYLYDSSGNIAAFSGKLDPLYLERWVRTHAAN